MALDVVGELCHKRSCHMNQKEMQRLAKDNFILEIKVQLEKCTDCLAHKQKPNLFPVETTDETEVTT